MSDQVFQAFSFMLIVQDLNLIHITAELESELTLIDSGW
jgi:hypothetical protein